MFDKFNRKGWVILNYFLDNPNKETHLRDIAKELKVSSSTAKIALDNLLKENFIIENKVANLRLFKCNLDNLVVRKLKTAKNLEWLNKTKIVEKVKKELNPISIVLFGSFAKGDNGERSDIDILVISDNKNTFKENFLGRHELQLIVMKPVEWHKKGKNEDPFYLEVIINGIPVYGRMPL